MAPAEQESAACVREQPFERGFILKGREAESWQAGHHTQTRPVSACKPRWTHCNWQQQLANSLLIGRTVLSRQTQPVIIIFVEPRCLDSKKCGLVQNLHSAGLGVLVCWWVGQTWFEVTGLEATEMLFYWCIAYCMSSTGMLSSTCSWRWAGLQLTIMQKNK